MTLPPPEVRELIRKLHALVSSPNENEALSARNKLLKLLARHELSWAELPAVLAATDTDQPSAGTEAHETAVRDDDKIPNVLSLVMALIEEHVAVTAEERMVIALWILHSYVFDRFPFTPRLALLSPVRGCGKTTLIVLLELLVFGAYRTDNITPAAIYHRLNSWPRTTLLIDEADNLDVFRNGVLRAVFNSGHRRGGGIDRFVGGCPQKFRVFAPLAVAAIDTLPLPLLHRAAVINMQRAAVQIERLDEADPAFAVVREGILRWAATCTLAQEPKMPPALRNRAADNWRVLLAIADNLGYSEEARAAAVKRCAAQPDEDPRVVLLADIWEEFQKLKIDRIASLALVEALTRQDDGPWHDWRGLNDDCPPRRLTQGELSRLLRPFDIRPKTIWPARRQPGDTSSRGYLRWQFEAAWRAYCASEDTPTQPYKVTKLLRA